MTTKKPTCEKCTYNMVDRSSLPCSMCTRESNHTDMYKTDDIQK